MKKKLKMWKSKKAQAGIGENIGNVLQTMPKPLLLVIFLVILLLFSAIFPFILNGFGVHCSSDDVVYTIPMFDLITNIKLIFERPSYEELTSNIVPTEKIFILDKCIGRQDNGTCYYDGTYCTDCEEGDITGIGGYKTENYCLGDVYRVDEKGFFKRWVCESAELGCEPPSGYYFDQSVCGYQCLGDNETCSQKTVAMMWDEKLIYLGGSPLYPTGEEFSPKYNKMFSLTCSNMKPSLNMYFMPLFDFRITLLLVVIGILFMFITLIGQMDK